jgi:metallo-beta-lactamase family protein
MKLGFFGGAGTVTGSRFRLQSGRRQILIDCGMFQGLKELRLLNWSKPRFDPRRIDAVVLTHAHIDHSGYLPRLVSEGFKGPIYCTDATRDLAEILLLDAAKIQEEDANYANRKGFSKHRPALPLFTAVDAQRALRLMQVRPLREGFDAAGFDVSFHDAGHILGSTFVEVSNREQGETQTIVFSGDLGRYDGPMHADPEDLPACDTLVMEATYGDRLHPEAPMEDQMAGPMRAILARGGTVLIPAFAVARAQLVLMLLRRMMRSGALPRVPVHLDSPMAIDVTDIYRRHAGTEHLELERADLHGDWVSFHSTVEQSIALNTLKGPRIIIASSGMMTGGRVLHHLKRLLPDPQNLLVLVGYQAAGTRGRKIAEGAKFIRMHGQDIAVKARVIEVEGLSAHADADELERWATSGPAPPLTAFLVHGEPGSLEALSARLASRGLDTRVPSLYQEYESAGPGDWQAVEPSK